MATYEYKDLAEQYEDFSYPIAVIEVNGLDIAKNDKQFIVNQIEVELTSGFEASIASFNIYNAFDAQSSKFMYQEVKQYIMIGSKLSIALGYANVARKVFIGVITKVNFLFDQDSSPYIHVTAMDVKGIMMAGSYAQQLKAKSYGEAVKEVLEKTAYNKLVDNEIISAIEVADTPDMQQKTPGAGGMPVATSDDGLDSSDYTIEMVNESDYEFVVRAAKRFDYEFFTQCGMVLFRRAKDDQEVVMEYSPGKGLYDFDIEYDITGIVNEIEVRGMDTGKAKMISSKQKFGGSVSNGNRAKALLSGSRKVYIDPTVRSTDEAKYRAVSLMEDMMYRVGSLTCMVQGTPEIVAGKQIAIKDLGGAASNYFYVTEVRHVLSSDGYYTYIKGKASSVGPESGDLSKLSLSGLPGLGGLTGNLGNITSGLGGLL